MSCSSVRAALLSASTCAAVQPSRSMKSQVLTESSISPIMLTVFCPIFALDTSAALSAGLANDQLRCTQHPSSLAMAWFIIYDEWQDSPASQAPIGKWNIVPPTSFKPASFRSGCSLCAIRGLRFDLSIAATKVSHHRRKADCDESRPLSDWILG